MTVQTSYDKNMPLAYAGLKASLMEDRVSSYKNAIGRDVRTLTVTPQNSTEYTVTVNGVQISYTSDGSATGQEIVDGLEAAALANPFFSALATLVEASSTTLTLSAKNKNDAFTVAISAELASAVVSSAGVNLPFGRIVALAAQSSEPAGGVLVTALSSGAPLAGATVHSHAVSVAPYTIPDSQDASAVGGDVSGYPPGEMVSVMQEGQIWLEAEESFDPGDAVYARFTSGTNAVIGRVRTDDDSSSAVLVPNCRAEKYDASTGLVLVTLNLPG